MDYQNLSIIHTSAMGISFNRAKVLGTDAITKRQADAFLRKDIRKFCPISRQFRKDSLLLAMPAYNVGPYRLLGSGKIPKSTLTQKLEAGDRIIYHEYIAFYNYKGKQHAILLKRRKAEFALLYIP